MKALAQRWNGEIYFSIPVIAKLESKNHEILEAGELDTGQQETLSADSLAPHNHHSVMKLELFRPLMLLEK